MLITELLISRGANVNHVNTAGQSVLHVALHHGHLRVAKCVPSLARTHRARHPCARGLLCSPFVRLDRPWCLPDALGRPVMREPRRRHLLRAGGRKCPGKCLKCNLNLKMLERQAAKREAARSAAAATEVTEPQAEDRDTVLQEEFGGISLSEEIAKLKAGGIAGGITGGAGGGPGSGGSRSKKRRNRNKRKKRKGGGNQPAQQAEDSPRQT